MNPHIPPSQSDLTFDTPNAMLRKLIEKQGAELKRVNELCGQLQAANAKLSGELLAAGEERKKVLAMLQANVSSLRCTTERVVKERDTIEAALRRLVEACANIETSPQAATLLPDIVKPFCEAEELLEVIDNLKASQKGKK